MPYSEEAKAKARAYLKRVRARTPCRICKRKPVDFHCLTHKRTPRQVGSLAAAGYPIARIKEVIAASDPLCRLCHMQTDGRHSSLVQTNSSRKGKQLKPRRPCSNCEFLVQHLRKGRCNYCYKRWRYIRSVMHSGVV